MSVGLSSNIVAVFFIPSAVFDVKSITPTTGFTTKPAIPFNVPLKNPSTPSFSAPYIGCNTKPLTPYPNPSNNDITPCPIPSTIC